MDGVSGVLAVGSFAIQLADTVLKLVRFWKDVQRVPADIQALFEELEVLLALLTEAQSTNFSDERYNVGYVALASCESRLSALWAKITRRVEDLGSCSTRKRKWSAFKIVLDKADIADLRDHIRSAKQMLVLSNLRALKHFTASRFQDQQLLLQSIYRVVSLDPSQRFHLLANAGSEKEITSMQLLPAAASGLALPTHSETRSPNDKDSNQFQQVPSLVQGSPKQFTTHKIEEVGHAYGGLKTPFGSMQMWTSTKQTKHLHLFESAAEQRELVYALYPSWLLSKFGVSHGIWISARSTNGWQYTIRPFNAVSGNALIFQFCKAGNVAAVQTLISAGQASVRDRDPDGRTPLWHASMALETDTADFLLREGADPHAITWYQKRSPIAGINDNTETGIDRKLSMITTFFKHSPSGYDDTSMLYLIGKTLLSYRPYRQAVVGPMSQAERTESVLGIVKKILDIWSPDDYQLTLILQTAIHLSYSGRVIQWLLRSINHHLHDDDHTCIIHEALTWNFLSRDRLSMRLVMEKSKDLHIARFPHVYTSYHSLYTPTSIAMFQPSTFFAWRDILIGMGLDLAVFVEEELGRVPSPLADEGWTLESLSSLFNMDDFRNYSPSGASERSQCQRCGRHAMHHWTMVDLPWRRYLRDIRCRKPATVAGVACRSPEISAITLHFTSGEAQSPDLVDEEGLPLATTDGLRLMVLPFEIVCSSHCYNDVCVAWVFETGSEDEVYFPPYVERIGGIDDDFVVTELASRRGEDDCPSRKIPGAFVD